MLTSRIRRSSRSVCTSIAEAWRRRHYPAAFVARLVAAQGEAEETRVHLDFARPAGDQAMPPDPGRSPAPPHHYAASSSAEPDRAP